MESQRVGYNWATFRKKRFWCSSMLLPVSLIHSFLLLSNILLSGYKMFGLLIHQGREVWVISIYWFPPPYMDNTLFICMSLFFLLLLLWLTGNLKIIQCGNSRNETLPFPESAIVAIFSISRDFWINSVNSVFFLVCDHWYHYSVSFTLAWIMIEQILP